MTPIVVVLMIILSCSKKAAKEPLLILSKDELALEEPLIAKVVDAPAGARYEWQIPHGVPVLQYAKDSSMIKLAFVRAIDARDPICVRVFSGSDTLYTACKNVEVDNVKFRQDSLDGSKAHQLTAGDQITLQPVIYATDSSLNFILKTSKNYSCLNSYLYSDISFVNNNIGMSLGWVWFSNNCEPVNMPVVSYSSTYHYYRDGTYPIKIYYDNKYYTGSLTVSKYQGKFEFNWPYTTGVLIEPKVLNQ
jgi:hypothetical protein